MITGKKLAAEHLKRKNNWLENKEKLTEYQKRYKQNKKRKLKQKGKKLIDYLQKNIELSFTRSPNYNENNIMETLSFNQGKKLYNDKNKLHLLIVRDFHKTSDDKLFFCSNIFIKNNLKLTQNKIFSQPLSFEIGKVNKPFFCLENFEHAIPQGEYPLWLDNTGKHKYFKIKEVKERRNIEIHSGNKISDTKGCLLIGVNFNAKKQYNSKMNIVQYSVLSCKSLRNRVNPVYDEPIGTIAIYDNLLNAFEAEKKKLDTSKNNI